MSSYDHIFLHSQGRLQPSRPVDSDHAFPLSLIDATAADFALTTAVWQFEKPLKDQSDLASHLRESLREALNAYPHWCGHVKAVQSIDGNVTSEAQHFPPHTRRYGRVYCHYGTPTDPGIEFVVGQSRLTLEDCGGGKRPGIHRTSDIANLTDDLVGFVPGTSLQKPLQPLEPDHDGKLPPAFAIKLTTLACGGFIIGASLTHALGDITALVQFMKDWAIVSRAISEGTQLPNLKPLIEPSQLDAAAAGDINSSHSDPTIVETAMKLPLIRHDWWAPSPSDPKKTSRIPLVFQGQDIPPTGDPLPWQDWDFTARTETYDIRFSKAQVDHLWAQAHPQGQPSASDSNLLLPETTSTSPPAVQRISRHDVVLAHLWSCIVRARNLSSDAEQVHCYPTIGLRGPLGLPENFIGSPVLMVDLKLPACDVAAATDSTQNIGKPSSSATLRTVAEYIRTTLSQVAKNPPGLAAHLHSVAFEKSPQRIWHGFLGKRHTMVTTWARSGVYDIDFGFHADGVSAVRDVDGIMPRLDGLVLINEGPPGGNNGGSIGRGAWTDNGVDVTLSLVVEDMERLIADPALMPIIPE